MVMNEGQALDSLFDALEFANPHTLFVDFGGVIIKAGKAFKKSLGSSKVGEKFEDAFVWLPGNGFHKMTENTQLLQFAETASRKQRYKISGRKTEWGYVLHGNPVVNAEFHISDYNLTLKDFSQQNYIAEYLFLLQSSTKALEELESINKVYVEKNKALEKSQEELVSTALFPNENPNPVVRIDINFQLTYANPAASKFIDDFSIVNKVLEDNELKKLLQEFYNADNDLLYYSLERNKRTYLLNIRHNLNQPFFNIYATDITRFVEMEEEKERELKQLNQRLDEQQQFYEYILNNIPSDIAVFDEHHRYLFVNPQGIKRMILTIANTEVFQRMVRNLEG
jgi:PAS domain-containing protein